MWSLLLAACEVDYQNVAQERILDSFAYVDAGAVPVGESSAFTLPLFSKADGEIRIFAIQSEDLTVPEGQVGPAFSFNDADWIDPLCERGGDSTGGCLDLTGYDPESDTDTWPLPMTFSPELEGYYEGIVTIWSNDSITQETAPLADDPEGQEYGVWRVQLRGLSRYACAQVFPSYHDFGRKVENGDFSLDILVESCGVVPVTVTAIEVVDTESMSSLTQTPLYVLPGGEESITAGWHVPPNTDGEPTPAVGTVTFASNSTELTASTVNMIGNTCNVSSSASFDQDSDGWSYCHGDCNDLNAAISPSVEEVADDGVDNDCDSAIDEAANPISSDDDGDGCSETGAGCGKADCDDADPFISPLQPELRNGIDDDCNGIIDDSTDGYDDDGDGIIELSGDCDDTNPLTYPGAEENPSDNADNDCDGIVDEGGPLLDDDDDGFADIEADSTMNDCDDRDPWVYVGAREYCDGYDNDCDNFADEGNPDDEGGLDAEGGACAFIPSRDTLASSVAATEGKSSGCNSTGAPAGLVSACFALGGVLVRRPRRA